MLDFGHLIDDHDAIDALADQLISAARSDQATAAECRTLLRAFVRRLRAHEAAEATFLRNDAPVHGRFATEARAFHAEFAELAAGWRGYLRRWTESAITDDRPGFIGETTDMMTALKLRIVRGNTVIYPLAVEAGLITPYVDPVH